MQQASSCWDFLATWWPGHTLPHTHVQIVLPIWWGLMDSAFARPTNITPLPPVIKAWPHDYLTCDIYESRAWERQCRISHSCLDLQATCYLPCGWSAEWVCELFSCSDIRHYVTDRCDSFYTLPRWRESSIWQKSNWKSGAAKYFSFI